ncbi:nucleoside hydrolase [Halococcus sp. IIIV-5B]|uniref:nucleoside hydrolase n=1 Tax=Halococcus sp. IIIV-5B TaxID=2321230 RepID=UPI000E7462DA|nr:nucleoside hydrolase [Halococcus sp. IIIV-5B]RJT05260.1 nucleoside hydrolase [Halococcus sp. IIIV-5B]
MKDLLVDCDPGHDDAMALLLALASDRVALEAVTTVAGNQTIEKTTRNACRVLTLADRTDVPVARGMGAPLVRDQVTAGWVHGESGLDGADLPEPETEPIERHAVETIAQTAAESGALHIAPVGPLTNVAVALRKHPDIVEDIERIVLMGGTTEDGNITPAAEFNVFADPEAAKVVFEADVDVTMVGLNVTREARLDRDHVARIREMESAITTVVADLLTYFLDVYETSFEWDGVPIHDACAVAEIVEPGVLDTEHTFATVETKGDLTYGRTVADVRGVSDDWPNVEAPNANVAVDIDRDRFVEMLLDAFETYR